MTPEGKVKAKIKAVLKRHGVYYCMPLGTMFGKAGVPDFIVCVRGRFLGIEAKAGKGKCTKLQELEHEQIRLSGGEVLVINEESLSLLEEWLEELLEKEL